MKMKQHGDRLFSLEFTETMRANEVIRENIKAKKIAIVEIYKQGAWKTDANELMRLTRAGNDLLFELDTKGWASKSVRTLQETLMRTVLNQIKASEILRDLKEQEKRFREHQVEAEQLARGVLDLLEQDYPQPLVSGPGLGSVSISSTRSIVAS